MKYEAHIISTQLNLMPFPYKIQEMNYLHANSAVKNTTYWLILIIPDNAYIFEI